jgi:hypothetical protein
VFSDGWARSWLHRCRLGQQSLATEAAHHLDKVVLDAVALPCRRGGDVIG